MAVQHMVWMKFHDGVSDEQIAEHCEHLRGLKAIVPGIVDIAVGENFTDRAEGCTHGLLVTLTDRAALETYATHPAHVAVADPLKRDAKLLAMDIEA